MAVAALVGIDPIYIMRCEDDVELALLRGVVAEAADIQAKWREDLANRIINTLGASLKGKRSISTTGSSTSTRS